MCLMSEEVIRSLFFFLTCVSPSLRAHCVVQLHTGTKATSLNFCLLVPPLLVSLPSLSNLVCARAHLCVTTEA